MRSIFLEKPDPAKLRAQIAGAGWFQVWLPVAFAVSVIMVESTNTFSAQHTSGWLRPIFERIFGHVNEALWSVLHKAARKSGHFTGYGLVCLTFLRAWLLTLGRKAGLLLRAWRWRSQGLALACTVTVASLDEWHQTFIPSRTGSATDVLIDTTGATTLSLLLWFTCWWILHRERRRAAQLIAA